MNELQLGLIGAGAVIVIGVVVYNGIQSRRVRRQLPRSMPVPEEAYTGPLDTEEEPPFIQPARPATRRESTAPVEPGLSSAPAGAGGNSVGATQAASAAATTGATPGTVAGTANTATPGTASAFSTSKPGPRRGNDPVVRREPTFGFTSGDASGDTSGDAAISPAPMPPADVPLDISADAAPADWGSATKPSELESPSGTHALDAGIEQPAPTQAAHAFDDHPASVPTPEPTAATRAEPVFMGEPLQSVTPAATTISNLPPFVVDRRIDCIVLLELGEAVLGDRVMPLAVRFRRAGSKPVYIEGLDEDGHWGTLRPGVRYRSLRAAVQLANRSGPLNELEFSEFVGGVHRIADALDAAAEFPDMGEVVQMARELDGFCAQCDAQLSVNVLSDGAPWSGSYVQAVASQDGLLLSRDGTRFVKLDAQQNPVFTMTFEGTNFLRDDLTFKGGHMITLLLDVPVADEDIMPWRLMCDYARSLAQRIGARVVDDQHRVLPDASLQAIDDRLMTLYARLEAAGISAGTPAARRLFSS